jgi:hypothetical protein
MHIYACKEGGKEYVCEPWIANICFREMWNDVIVYRETYYIPKLEAWLTLNFKREIKIYLKPWVEKNIWRVVRISEKVKKSNATDITFLLHACICFLDFY